MKKRLIATLIAAMVLSAALTGCGGNEENTGTEGQASSQTAESEASSAESEAEVNASVSEEENNDFEYNLIEGGIEIHRYNGTAATVQIPEEINGEKVVKIGGMMLYQNKIVEEVIIPDTVTEVADSAFMESIVTKVLIPDTVTKIGENIFLGCTKLENIEINARIEAIESCTITNSLIKTFTVPETVTEIKQYAFQSNAELEEVIIPPTTTEIDSQAFDECPKVTITGQAGSYAETFAKENDIPFTAQ